MNTPQIEPGQSFLIGSILVEPSRNILTQGDDVFALEPRIMDVLVYLANRQGAVCSRDDIISAIWKVEYGADESLTRAVSLIRKAFRKGGGRGAFIQTISKRGYSLQVPVTPWTDVSASDIALGPIVPPTSPKPPAQTTPAVTSTPILSVTAPEASLPNSANFISDVVETDVSTARPRGTIGSSARRLLVPIGLTGAIVALLFTGRTLRSPSATLTSFGGSVETSPYGRTVAVLPFKDLSAGQDNQYFSEGLAVEILNEVGKISSLRVIAQNTDSAKKNQGISYKEMGAELAVSHIIHGAIRKQDDRVRITAQLINTADNQRAWSANYDGTLEDVFELQQNVSQDIATELILNLDLALETIFEFDDPLMNTFVPQGN